MERRMQRDWRPVILVFAATLVLVLGTIVAYLFLARDKLAVTPLLANSRIPSGYSFTVLAKFKVGDVFGDGREALVVNMPEPSKAFEWPMEDRPGSYVTAVYRMRGRRLWQVYRSAPQPMPVNEVTLADTNGNGRQEIWFGHSSDDTVPAALEWEGTGFSPLPAWAGWPRTPVVIGAVAGGAPAGGGGADALLAFGEYVTPELARDLFLVAFHEGRWEKAGAVLPARQAFSPKDRALVADADGDQRPELLYATGRMNLLAPPRPFTISRFETGEPVLTLEGVFPDDVELADLNGNGIPEIYLSENLPLEVGRPYRGAVRGIEWDGREFALVFYEEFDNQRWVCDLASGDLDGDGKKNLLIGILRTTDGLRLRFSLEMRGYGGPPKVARGGVPR